MARMRPGWANKLPQVSGRRAARAAPDQQFSIYSILGRDSSEWSEVVETRREGLDLSRVSSTRRVNSSGNLARQSSG